MLANRKHFIYKLHFICPGSFLAPPPSSIGFFGVLRPSLVPQTLQSVRQTCPCTVHVPVHVCPISISITVLPIAMPGQP